MHNINIQYSHGDDTEYTAAVRQWARKIPIGLGLCPWAVKSCNKGLIRVVTCMGETPADAAEILEREIESLTCCEGGTPPPLSTTLMVCPYVKDWREFDSFDEFVKSGFKQRLKNDAIMEDVTLVAFHPNFSRWHGLPEGIGVGSVVQSHWKMMGQKQSVLTAPATIIETNNKAFGLRKVKIRFHEDLLGGGISSISSSSSSSSRREQFVPTNWIDFSGEGVCDPEPLPDNVMHRSPHPTIHVIVNQDLVSMSIRDVSRVKRLNAQRMAKLGWEGLERRLADDDDVDVHIK